MYIVYAYVDDPISVNFPFLVILRHTGSELCIVTILPSYPWIEIYTAAEAPNMRSAIDIPAARSYHHGLASLTLPCNIFRLPGILHFHQICKNKTLALFWIYYEHKLCFLVNIANTFCFTIQCSSYISCAHAVMKWNKGLLIDKCHPVQKSCLLRWKLYL